MACPTITVAGVTREVWECIRRRAASFGVTVPPGDSGTIRHQEAEVEYAWDPAAGTLAVTVTHQPAWIGCDAIGSRIRQAASGCGAG